MDRALSVSPSVRPLGRDGPAVDETIDPTEIERVSARGREEKYTERDRAENSARRQERDCGLLTLGKKRAREPTATAARTTAHPPQQNRSSYLRLRSTSTPIEQLFA